MTRRVRSRRPSLVGLAIAMTLLWALSLGVTRIAGLPYTLLGLAPILATTALATGAWMATILVLTARAGAAKSLGQLQALSPEAFEEWAAARFRQLGYRVKLTGASGDHGVDLLLERDGQVEVVQCKNYRANRIGEPILRDLYGAMHDHEASRAHLVSTGTLTAAARAWAEGKPIEVWDGPRLAWLAQTQAAPGRPPVGSPAAAVPSEPRDGRGAEGQSPAARPVAYACPRCGRTLVRRVNRSTGELFLACPGYPRCRYTHPLPE